MAFELELTVVPKSSCNKLIMEQSCLKLKITAPPSEDQANKQVINILAKLFHCTKTSIELKSGRKFKKKKFLLKSVSQELGQKILDNLYLVDGELKC